MRSLSYILLICLAIGCGSAPSVPVPKTTRYDSDPKEKRAYSEGYRLGYRDYLAGKASGSGPDVFSDDPAAKARMFGWYDGREAASDVQYEKNRAARQGAPK